MSKQVSNNPRKFLPALRSGNRDYMALLTLALRIVAFMTANVAFYALPNPALIDVTAQATALRDAIGLGGSKWNRRSKSALTLIQAEAETLRGMIIALIAYAVNTAATSDSQQTQALYNFLLSGISVKKKRALSGKNLDIIRRFKIQTTGTNLSSITFSWEKPKGMIKGQPARLYTVEFYNQLGLIWVTIGNSTRTNFTWNNGSGLLSLNELTVRVTPISRTGMGQPYIFKVMSSKASSIAKPFTTSDSLDADEITTPTLNVFYPYTNVTLSAADSDMTFYLSASDGGDITLGEATLVIPANTSQTMTLAALKLLLNFDPATPFFCIKNTGAVTGIYTVTLFVP